MIKRVLALVLLLVLGFLLLRLAVGEGEIGTFGAVKKQLAPESASRPARSGLVLGEPQQGEQKKPVRVTFDHGLDLNRKREIPLAGGSVMLLRVYRLVAEDSTPLSGDRHRLDRVTITFYELGGGAADPHEVVAGVLKAREMLVQLTGDRAQASLREDKELELKDAVLTTTSDARVKDLTMTIAHAFVLVEQRGTQLRTASEDDPFELRMAGQRPLVMTGHGLVAFLPATRSLPGGVTAPRNELLTIHVKKDPDLRAHGASGESRLTAAGELVYEERTADGHASVVVSERVRLTEDGASRATASGERLTGVLLRGKKQGDAHAWRRIELSGAPARVDAQGAALSCERVLLLPGMRGDPYWIQTLGKDAQLVQGASTFRAARGIRLLRLAGWQPLTKALAPRLTEVIWFDGGTTLVQDVLAVSASEGIRVLRGSNDLAPVTLTGYGAVDVKQGALHLVGDSGFTLSSVGGDGEVSMRSDRSLVRVTMETSELFDASELHVTFAERKLVRFRAGGAPCRIRAKSAEGEVTGAATELESNDGRSFALTGAPASVVRGAGETLTAERIDIVRGSARATLLLARGKAHLLLESAPNAGDKRLPPIDLEAKAIRLVPFVVPRELLVGVSALRSPWLIADGDVKLLQKDEQGKQLARGFGDRLVLRLEEVEGLLYGAPAHVVASDASGRENKGDAPRIRLSRRGTDQVATLMPFAERQPHFVVESTSTVGGASRYEITCAGNVELTTARIVFGGPVRMYSLREDGERDERGFSLSARELTLDRDPKTGDLEKLVARGDVILVSAQMLVQGESATVQPRTGWFEMHGGKKDVTVESATRFSFATPMFAGNYLTGESRGWRGAGGQLKR